MKQEDFKTISQWIESEIGLHLEPKKMRMMDQRLGRLIKSKQLSSVTHLADSIRDRNLPSTDRQLVIDALVTNETQFFRGEEVFKEFHALMCEKLDREHTRKINIWSAAASTGQEPYSIAMIFEKMKNLKAYRDLNYSILATDVSNHAISYARQGRYTHYETQRGLNIREIIQWFKEDGRHWVIDPTLRSHIRFNTMNLLKDTYPSRTFDAIFLRNILIYYERDVRNAILDKIIASLADGGLLILGGTEGIDEHKDQLAPVQAQSSRIYQKREISGEENRKAAPANAPSPAPQRTLDEIEWPFVGQ